MTTSAAQAIIDCRLPILHALFPVQVSSGEATCRLHTAESGAQCCCMIGRQFNIQKEQRNKHVQLHAVCFVLGSRAHKRL